MAFDTKKLVVDYKSLARMTPTDRTNAAKRGMINDLLSALTPTQIANLFPRYYREQLPSLGGFQAATDAMTKASRQGSGDTTGSSAAPYKAPQRPLSPAEREKYANMSAGGKNRVDNIKAVYNAYRTAGLSHKQALAFTAEVGRENDYNNMYLYGTHTDLNGETNIGMISMQKDRRVALQAYLAQKGLLDENGRMVPGQATLNAQAEFQIQEIKDKYPRTAKEFLANPDIDPEQAAVILGDDYIRWARRGNLKIGFTPEQAASHDEKRRRNYYQAEKIVLEQAHMGPDASTVNPNAAEMQTAEPLPNGVVHGTNPQSDVFPQGTAMPVSDDFTDLQSSLGSTDVFTERSSQDVKAAGIKNVDHRLVKIGDAGIRAFEKLNPGYTVRVTSGKRTPETNSGSATSRHLYGGAVDYQIVDPNGMPLPNLGGGKTGIGPEAGRFAPKYQELGRYMEAARQKLAQDDPSYAEAPVVQGLYFGGDWWMDSMHAQLGGASALGDTVGGFKDPDQLRREGQPEYIVQAVEQAQAAGATSLKPEEMQNVSSFLYDNADIPVETLIKINQNIAIKKQNQAAPAQTETAVPAPNAPQQGTIGNLPGQPLPPGTQPGVFPSDTSPQTINNTPANPTPQQQQSAPAPSATVPAPAPLPPASGQESVIPPVQQQQTPAYTSGVSNKDMGDVKALISTDTSQQSTGKVESVASGESPTGQPLEPIKIMNDKGLVASMRPDEGIQQQDNGSTRIVPQTQMNANQQVPNNEVSARNKNPVNLPNPSRSLGAGDKIAGDAHSTPSFNRAISRAVGKDLKSHFGVN